MQLMILSALLLLRVSGNRVSVEKSVTASYAALSYVLSNSVKAVMAS